ncbi:unnamed protein product [Diabrotica balteata]|uniref:Uncharacterized protein n=2 Tax=Diabrotica balteata TaxID=107213 RepID=A0A9N9X420_DIABA|nr:unnamed protein product [Diabrotica balteata]
MNRKSEFGGFKFPKKMFEIDPDTGKIIPLPLNFESDETDNLDKVDKKSSNFSKLEPLDFNKLRMEIEESERQSKKRKIDAPNSAKRLFTSMGRQTDEALVNKRRSKNVAIPRKSKILQNPSCSPLLDMEEVEKDILTNKKTLGNVPFKPIVKQNKKVTNSKHGRHTSKKTELDPKYAIDKCKNIPEIQTNSSDEPETDDAMKDEPKTPDSSREFHKLELICNDSPITNMCNLMQDTVINSIKKPKLNNNSNSNLTVCINNIENIIRNEELSHQQSIAQLNQAIRNEKLTHQQSIAQLNNVLQTLKSLVPDENHDKENQNSSANRRSERLLKTTPLKNTKLLTSPAILRSDDLRKSTLKKNMVAKNPYCKQSPRVQKALELYNSLRSHASVLETPRSDRKNSNLSSRIQSQCLLLQDTPVHHK